MALYIYDGTEYKRWDDGSGNIQTKNVIYDTDKDEKVEENKIDDIHRSKIVDFFNSPFWDNIPDKPSVYPPEAHTHSRSDITDFFNAPFWNNIPDKPSTFPPQAHASSHAPSGSDSVAQWYVMKAGDTMTDTLTIEKSQDSGIPIGLKLSNQSSNNTYALAIEFCNNSSPDHKVRICVDASVLKVLHTQDNWSTTVESIRFTPSSVVVIKDMIPHSGATVNLGTSDKKFNDIYVVNAHIGDLNFDNGWKLTEGDKVGVDEPIVLVSPDGKIYKLNLERLN